MSSEPERIQILKMIEEGVITPAEGLNLLKALEGDTDEAEEMPSVEAAYPHEAGIVTGQAASSDSGEPVVPAPGGPQTADVPYAGSLSGQAGHESAGPTGWEEQPPASPAEGEVVGGFAPPPKFGRWQHWWQIPLAVGVGITVVGALLMFFAWQASGIGFWFACAWFPFLLGVGLVALAWASRSLRWLHLRIHQKPGERPQTIAISLPLPLRLGAWIVRLFGHRIPNVDSPTLDQMISALENTSPEAPFYMQVNEDGGGHIEIFIG